MTTSIVQEYPRMIVPVDHVEPVPRRIRAVLAGEVVLDTVRARYVWEWPGYPQYHVPIADVKDGLLVDEHSAEPLSRGTARLHGLHLGETSRPASAHVYGEDAIDGLKDTVRFEWDGLDAWFEEDEQVFVHPRNPYARVDALRSTRDVRVELEGVVLAESSAPVMVFETGLPTRCYLDPSAVNFEHLRPSETVTACPYKGRTTGYWSICLGERTYPDLAWTYDFPTRQLLPIAGLVAFYDEKVDVFLDGEPVARPETHFSLPATPRRR